MLRGHTMDGDAQAVCGHQAEGIGAAAAKD